MSVYKRGDKGVFYMNFTVNGVRVYKSTGKFTKKDAKQVEANEKQKLIDEANATPQQKATRMKLSEVVKELYDVRWKHNKDSVNSLARGEKVVEILGDIPIGEVSQEDVRKIMVHLQGRGNKPATVNRTLEVLKTMLKYKKLEWDYIKLSRVSKGRIRVISIEEEHQAVKHFKETKRIRGGKNYSDIGDLIICLVDTGMRLGEMLKLRYEDVNFKTNLITIWINKGGRPRSIPMTKRVREIMLARKDSSPDMPFHLNNDQAINAWQWVRKEMGLHHDREFVLHALRHTCASRLLNKGVDIVTIRDWLGHADISTTMIYAHLAPNKLAHAAAILDSYDHEKVDAELTQI
jgi:integrase